MSTYKKIIGMSCVAGTAAIALLAAACSKGGQRAASTEAENSTAGNMTQEELEAAWEEAKTTPLGKYPEKVTYTLGKVTAENNSNMPEGDTYDDNNYTRYIEELLNVESVVVLEGQDHNQYEQVEKMAILDGELPDIMVVTDTEILDMLVENDLIEDLTDVYVNCTSDRIKEMYESFGDDKLGAVTYNGKLMAFPETEVYTGPNLLWLRKDWIDDLGLEEPTTLDEAMDIVKAFVEQNPGGHPDGNVGLVFDPSLVGQSDQCFSVDSVFDACHAYPGKWIKDENGSMVYGSVTQETKAALAQLGEWYQEGILDQDFMIRNVQNLPELLENGRSGAFFGWWWAPNNPLSSIYDEGAEWKPYLFTDENGVVETSISYGRHYCVVARKGFEHPEIIPKVLSALFDYARYDGKEEAEGVGEYLGTNVDPTATPFVINMDYSDAIFRATDSILSVMDGTKEYSDMTVLEQGYYNSCIGYLNEEETSEAWQWAAYTSRITAVSALMEADVTYVNEGYTQQYDQLETEKLKQMEEEAFIKIIIGEYPADYFDTFIEAWYAEGGRELTDQANKIAEKQ